MKDFSIVLSTVGPDQYLDEKDLIDTDYDVNYDD